MAETEAEHQQEDTEESKSQLRNRSRFDSMRLQLGESRNNSQISTNTKGLNVGRQKSQNLTISPTSTTNYEPNGNGADSPCFGRSQSVSNSEDPQD